MDPIAALEVAPEGSRKLDKAIYVALGLPITNHARLSQRQIDVHLESVAPHYSTSLDAALSWMPEGCKVTLRTNTIRPQAIVHCPPNQKIGNFYGKARTLAMALCIAIWKARQAMEATP